MAILQWCKPGLFARNVLRNLFLYDFISGIPIWAIAMYALLPVLMPLGLLGLDFLLMPTALIYAYLLACAIDFIVKAVKK